MGVCRSRPLARSTSSARPLRPQHRPRRARRSRSRTHRRPRRRRPRQHGRRARGVPVPAVHVLGAHRARLVVLPLAPTQRLHLSGPVPTQVFDLVAHAGDRIRDRHQPRRLAGRQRPDRSEEVDEDCNAHREQRAEHDGDRQPVAKLEPSQQPQLPWSYVSRPRGPSPTGSRSLSLFQCISVRQGEAVASHDGSCDGVDVAVHRCVDPALIARHREVELGDRAPVRGTRWRRRALRCRTDHGCAGWPPPAPGSP